MAYNHMAVSTLEERHASTQEFINDRGGVMYLNEKLFDGIPMRDNLANLCQAVRKQYKDIAFMCDANSTSSYAGIRKIDAIWAYFPGDTYALVRLSYERAGNDGTSAFVIKARGIQNGRYGTHHAEHHTLTTTDLAKATKHVKTYLRPYTVGEMAEISYGDFRGKATNRRSAFDTQVHSTRMQITQHTGFTRELANIIASDYKFLSGELKGHITDYLAAVKDKEERATGRINVAYVSVRMQGDQQAFDVVRGTKCVSDAWGFYPSVREDMVTYNSETLPENIMSKLAILSMLERGEYLADTGMKHSATTFWVQI